MAIRRTQSMFCYGCKNEICEECPMFLEKSQVELKEIGEIESIIEIVNEYFMEEINFERN